MCFAQDKQLTAGLVASVIVSFINIISYIFSDILSSRSIYEVGSLYYRATFPQAHIFNLYFIYMKITFYQNAAIWKGK